MRILDILYPENLYCACCGDTMEQSRYYGICDKCASSMDWVPKIEAASYLDDYAFDQIISCCRYGYQGRRIMNAFKGAGNTYLGRNLGKILAERVLMELGEEGLPDFAIAVPMHQSKLDIRGFNQAELVARYMCDELGIVFLKDALIKTKATASMRSAGANERHFMLEDCFALNPSCKDETLSILYGSSLILVDDVITTASTMQACALALREAHPRHILAASVFS